MNFFKYLELTAKNNNSLLCVGLDPRAERASDLFVQNRRVIDATCDMVCCFKPNIAFYEAFGAEGWIALKQTIDYIGADVPVILDAKRGDIGSTAEAYARAVFEVLGVGAVTLAPYLGGDSVRPFTAYADRGAFVLCHTSNPGAAELQGLVCNSEPLYHQVARLAQGWSDTDNVGLVVGATFPTALRAVREIAPSMWFLVPGVGAQGGDVAQTVRAGLCPDGLGLIVNVSRAVANADDPRAAAMALRDEINAARPPLNPPRSRGGLQGGAHLLVLDLARIGAVRFGQFTLKSGKISPIYIDLRILASYPDVLARAAAAYSSLLHKLEYDRIAAIPYAALPIGTVVALQTGRPLIYPRKEVKDYGTRRAVEGMFAPGETVVVLDDLITTGGSKIEAIQPLQEAGLRVQDIVVLIDRESGGREELERQGCCLHAVLTLRQILDVLVQENTISDTQRAEVLDWLAAA
ncbi:MAG: orotidine-5'-phosphate decarboxylase [Anaerolineae bacterium]|nr:orotidine-5'-phosphate decarboxylase [Anaerolineae bacterium]